VDEALGVNPTERVLAHAELAWGLSGISCASGADIFSGDHRL
jgi:hypothetical protein